MNEEMIARGQNAERVLETNEFKQLVDDVRRDVFEQFVKTNVGDAKIREELHGIVYSLDLLLLKANKYANDYKFELTREDRTPEA